MTDEPAERPTHARGRRDAMNDDTPQPDAPHDAATSSARDGTTQRMTRAEIASARAKAMEMERLASTDRDAVRAALRKGRAAREAERASRGSRDARNAGLSPSAASYALGRRAGVRLGAALGAAVTAVVLFLAVFVGKRVVPSETRASVVQAERPAETAERRAEKSDALVAPRDRVATPPSGAPSSATSSRARRPHDGVQ
jgi:hypothetical protein